MRVRAGGERRREGEEDGGRAGRSSLWSLSSRAMRDTTAPQLLLSERTFGDRSGTPDTGRVKGAPSARSQTTTRGSSDGSSSSGVKGEKTVCQISPVASLSQIFPYSPKYNTCTVY